MHRYFFLLSTLVMLATSAVYADEPYRILITNDDGIHAPGLQALVDVLSDQAEIIVAAPAEKSGGTGHATNLWEGPMKIDEVDLKGSSLSYAVHGMPADAARFGILMATKLGKKIDLVISGINSGDNIGSGAHISGTVGAAMEALYYEISSIAVSLDGEVAHHDAYGGAANFVNALVPEIQKNGIPAGVMLNVNVPGEIKGVKIAPMGDYTVEVSSFEVTEDGFFKAEITYPASKMPGSDAYEWERGYITVSPQRLDTTDADTLKALESWDLKTGMD